MSNRGRKCENCGYLATEGYEYPETYCAAGVPEDDPRIRDDGEGCTYTKAQLKRKYDAIMDFLDHQYDWLDEYMEQEDKRREDEMI